MTDQAPESYVPSDEEVAEIRDRVVGTCSCCGYDIHDFDVDDVLTLMDEVDRARAALAELQGEFGVINAEWGVQWPDGSAEKMISEGDARWIVRRDSTAVLRRRLVGEWQNYKQEQP